jgi:hypothetical protein
MVVIGAMVPMSEPRIPMNHIRTAHWIIQLTAAERQYAERFPAAGFTCNLHQLAQVGIVDKVLGSGERAGYRYELHGCDTTAPVSAFSISAVPLAQGRTGEFAFCANQEGVVWYAKGGSADECFKARTRWPKSDDLARTSPGA